MAITVPGRGPLGRPTDLTPERQQRILALVRQGHYASTACAAAGISESTYYEWLSRGGRGESPYAEFADALKQVDAEAELALWGVVLAGTQLPSTGGVIAAGIAVERRWPERYGRRDRLLVEQRAITEIHVEVSFRPLPVVVDGAGTPQQVVEGEVRELEAGEAGLP